MYSHYGGMPGAAAGGFFPACGYGGGAAAPSMNHPSVGSNAFYPQFQSQQQQQYSQRSLHSQPNALSARDLHAPAMPGMGQGPAFAVHAGAVYGGAGGGAPAAAFPQFTAGAAAAAAASGPPAAASAADPSAYMWQQHQQLQQPQQDGYPYRGQQQRHEAASQPGLSPWSSPQLVAPHGVNPSGGGAVGAAHGYSGAMAAGQALPQDPDPDDDPNRLPTFIKVRGLPAEHDPRIARRPVKTQPKRRANKICCP